MSKRAADAGEAEPFSADQLEAIEKAHKDFQRLEIAANRLRQKTIVPGYEARDKVLNAINGFWVQALENNPIINSLLQQDDEKKALGFLKSIRAWRDPDQLEAFGYEFTFDTNPFFSNTKLTKEYKYVAPSDPSAVVKDDHGVSEADLDFDLARDTDVATTTIEWKDESKSLTKRHPQIVDPEDAEEIEEFGSFFHVFEKTKGIIDVDTTIIEIYESAVDFFLGRADGGIGDFDDDDDDEDDDSEAEEIDLEKPKKKKAKN